MLVEGRKGNNGNWLSIVDWGRRYEVSQVRLSADRILIRSFAFLR